MNGCPIVEYLNAIKMAKLRMTATPIGNVRWGSLSLDLAARRFEQASPNMEAVSWSHKNNTGPCHRIPIGIPNSAIEIKAEPREKVQK
jgi:hypothetical protein